METKPTDAREVREQELNEALEAHAEKELEGLSIQNQRLARVQEYEDEAVSRPDSYAAVIGVGNASFQRVFEHLAAAVLEELDSRPHTVDELREFAPEIRLLVKLRNAIEKDLEFRVPDAEQTRTASARCMKGKGLDTKMTTSKRDLLPKRWMGNA